MISIDETTWEVPCDVERTADITPSEISGMMLDKTYLNDVIGTYMSYAVTLAVPPTKEYEYVQLYEILTQPVDGHRFILPYNQGMVAITARVESVKDVLVWTKTNKQYWRGVTFTAIANHPTKTMELGEVLLRGLAEVPNVTLPTGGGMVYDDLDVEYF